MKQGAISPYSTEHTGNRQIIPSDCWLKDCKQAWRCCWTLDAFTDLAQALQELQRYYVYPANIRIDFAGCWG